MEYDIQKAKEEQAKYCKEKGFPHFAPSSGKCWMCGKNVYEQVGWKTGYNLYGIPVRSVQVPIDSSEVEFTTGISVEKAGSETVTGCPHCNASYCD